MQRIKTRMFRGLLKGQMRGQSLLGGFHGSGRPGAGPRGYANGRWASGIAIYAVLGVVGGFVSVAFTKVLTGLRERFLNLPRKTLWFQPVAGGLLVGIMGWFVPQVLGVGYQHVGSALNGSMAVKLMVLLSS